MIISVDTEIMRLMANLSRDIDTELDGATSHLTTVVDHNDWNCKERDVINETVNNVKKRNQRLKEDFEHFDSVIQQIANQFDEAEAAIPQKYQALDVLTGSILSSSSYGGSVSNSAGQSSAAMANTIQNEVLQSGLENYEIGNLTDGIQVCDFSNVDFSGTV